MKIKGPERPAIGKLKAGNPVILVDPTPGAVKRTKPATVVKVARVWVTVQGDGPTVRLRMDSQSESTGYGYGGWQFATPEQHDFDERLRAAREVLNRAEIFPRYRSPFNSPAGVLALAEAVAKIIEESGDES